MKTLISLLALFLAVPAAAQLPLPQPPDASPIFIGATVTINSEVLEQPRTINVYVPPNYDAEDEPRFPVLYLIDGGIEQDFHHITGLAQHGAISRTFDAMIVVGIETENRQFELTSPSDEERYPDWMRPNGNAANFRAFIRSEVMPWVEANYRTNGHNTVIGESLAGYFVADSFLRDPALFDDYVAISPSLWWDNGSLIDEAETLLAAHDDAPRQLYLSIGNEGGPMHRRLEELVALLEADAPDNLQWLYVDRSATEHHGSIFHIAALDAFRTLYGQPTRLGAPTAAWWIFEQDPPPPLTPEAEADIARGTCTLDDAQRITIAEHNADRDRWNGMCVLAPLGPQRMTRGNFSR